MPSTRGIVWHGRGDIRLEEVALPTEPPPAWMRCRVAWCGICGTDAEEVGHGPLNIPLEPHPLLGTSAPLVLGHEVAAVVEELGEGVEGFGVGDAVVSDALIGCGTCDRCRRGDVNACDRMATVGLHFHGGLAETVDLPAASCVRIGTGVPLDVAALAEPAAVAVRALNRAGLAGRGSVLVVGAGTVGLLAVAVARRRGHRVVAVDPSERQRDLALMLGADETAAAVEDWIPVEGQPWAAVECSGNTSALNAAIERLPWASRVVLVGIHSSGTATDLLGVVLREHTLVGSLSHDRADFADAVAIISGEHDRLRALIGARVGLDEGIDVLRRFASGQAPIGKTLVGAEPPQTSLGRCG